MAIKEFEHRGNVLTPEVRPHIGFLGHDHINLVGYYPFESGQEYSLDKLLPLRSVNEIAIADEEDIEAYAASSGIY